MSVTNNNIQECTYLRQYRMKIDIIFCIDTLDYLIYLNITGLRFGNCKVDVLRNGHQGQIGQFPATV